jgi:hypothetical protein
VTQHVTIWVDADACPVKAEIYRVAERLGCRVVVVSNGLIAIPNQPWIERAIVDDKFDAADDWIAERAGAADIVVTADIKLAARCVRSGATVLTPTGRALDDASMGMALATRNLMEELRASGQVTGGPKPFSARDRSAFLSALDLAVVRKRRRRR